MEKEQEVSAPSDVQEDDVQEDIDALVEQQMLEALAAEAMEEAQTDSLDEEAVEEMAENLAAEEPEATVKPAQFQDLMDHTVQDKSPQNIEMLMDVTLLVSIELGRTTMNIKDILEMNPGSIIELNKMAGEPVDVLVNKKLIARGEVVVVEENFGVRVTDLVSPEERIKSL